MGLLIVAATKLEIEPFLATNHSAGVLITGIGIPATIFNLSNKLSQAKYDLVVQAGIGGTFNNDFKTSEVFVIEKDAFADLGVSENGNLKTLFEMGFADPNDFPFNEGWLKNENQFITQTGLPLAAAVTINTITDDKEHITKLREKFHPDIESMEGASFHYVCLQQQVNFLQIRSISNIVGERDKSKWKMQEAIFILNDELQKLIKKFDSK